MMKHLILTLSIAIAFILAGCAETGRYPVSGEECGPNDPVLSLDASDCVAVPAGI
ncbi:hypothetical protein ACEWPN_19260 [Yoonia sp. R2-816]|uniref:hypothetical protein n=2 Tax=unclassified Yoonia TaxID=2629118 RepID=UPI003726C586